MDKLSPVDVTPLLAQPPVTAKKAVPASPAPSPQGYDADHVDAARMSGLAESAKGKPVTLSADQREAIAQKKATCPFIGSAVAKGDLAVRQSADRPLASIDDVVALGNSGGGDLGELLKLFASGNHAFMAGPSGKLDAPVPSGLFSLDFPGSQGSHPGHSGILLGDPTQTDSGRFSPSDFERLTARARDGYVKRSDVAAFIAENLARDPEAKVFGTHVGGLLLGDTGRSIAAVGPAIVEKLKGLFHVNHEDDATRKLTEAVTKNLGEDNLVGSAGEFGLLMAFLANSPKTKDIGGEPALAVSDLQAMFQQHRLPEGWETWRKTRLDWATNTTALLVTAGKDYQKLKKAAPKA